MSLGRAWTKEMGPGSGNDGPCAHTPRGKGVLYEANCDIHFRSHSVAEFHDRSLIYILSHDSKCQSRSASNMSDQPHSDLKIDGLSAVSVASRTDETLENGDLGAIFSKQRALETGHEIRYRSCSWQKVRQLFCL